MREPKKNYLTTVVTIMRKQNIQFSIDCALVTEQEDRVILDNFPWQNK